MLIGYARTSTVQREAELVDQMLELEAAGCEKIFDEKIGAAVAKRPQLNSALDSIGTGDVLIVTELDRLARSVADFLGLINIISRRGATLRILNLGGSEWDSSNPIGKSVLTTLGAVSKFERALQLERQREGIAVAKAAGKYKGREATARKKTPEVQALHSQGRGPATIANQLAISRASVQRILRSLPQ